LTGDELTKSIQEGTKANQRLLEASK
jgi:hypothetical protein